MYSYFFLSDKILLKKIYDAQFIGDVYLLTLVNATRNANAAIVISNYKLCSRIRIKISLKCKDTI